MAGPGRQGPAGEHQRPRRHLAASKGAPYGRAQPTAPLARGPSGVLIEAGMALANNPTRTVLAVLGTQELPTDLAGRHYIRLSHTAAEPLHDLAGRLQAAGCDTDTSGAHWLNPARFPDRDTIAPAPPRPSTAGHNNTTTETATWPALPRLRPT
jgi:hypothetical protein